MFCLGAGANLLLYFLLKAFQYSDASFLAPFRYIELIFSTLIGWGVFQENISFRILLGASIILTGSIINTFYEKAK